MNAPGLSPSRLQLCASRVEIDANPPGKKVEKTDGGDIFLLKGQLMFLRSHSASYLPGLLWSEF